MISRLLSLLLIASVLVSQLARIPHAHFGMAKAEQSRHDETPHVHLAGHGHTHSHSHSHDHDQSTDESEEPIDASIDSDQGSHALAISVDLSPTTKTSSPEVQQDFSPALVRYQGNGDDEQPLIVRFRRPPNLSIFDGSETYLKLRQLRI